MFRLQLRDMVSATPEAGDILVTKAYRSDRERASPQRRDNPTVNA
jgi:hypothetical protein